MKPTIRSISWIVFAAEAVWGQTPGAGPKFELADVHLSSKPGNTSGGVLRGSRYDLHNATMVDLIRTANNLDDNRKVVGGPGWMDMDRFEIAAKAPPSTPPETLRLMLQDLLAERFKLAVHKDNRPMSLYVLSLGKGKPKMKEAKQPSAGGDQGCIAVLQNPTAGEVPYNVRACHAVSMDELAARLPGMAGNYVSWPVINQTGLAGLWDFELKWTSRGQVTAAGSSAITMPDAIDKQLGLKLELKPVPLDVIVVDSVNQKPTENAPGVTGNIPPPPPAEFEVASIRASAPDQQQTGSIRNDRLDFRAFSLKALIEIAWDINNDDMLANVPKFAESAKFDIVAKASAPIDVEDLPIMMRALLAERFKLATHSEQRPINTFVLSAVKSKLKKADPANRSGCKTGPGPDGKDPRDATPVNARLITCLNTTMAQLAEAFQTFPGGYIQTSVLNETGIEGAYDFTLNYANVGLIRRSQAAGADPNGAISLFEAVDKQLGLKLEQQKRPAQVLVVDHVEETPTDN